MMWFPRLTLTRSLPWIPTGHRLPSTRATAGPPSFFSVVLIYLSIYDRQIDQMVCGWGLWILVSPVMRTIRWAEWPLRLQPSSRFSRRIRRRTESSPTSRVEGYCTFRRCLEGTTWMWSSSGLAEGMKSWPYTSSTPRPRLLCSTPMEMLLIWARCSSSSSNWVLAFGLIWWGK